MIGGGYSLLLCCWPEGITVIVVYSANKREKLNNPVRFPSRLDLSRMNVPLGECYRVYKISPADLRVDMRSLFDVASNSPTGPDESMVQSLSCIRSGIMSAEEAGSDSIEEEEVQSMINESLFKVCAKDAIDDGYCKPRAVFESPAAINTASPQLSTVRRQEPGLMSETAYHLTAVVRHLGRSAGAGHYICDSLLTKDKTAGTKSLWERYNDSVVTTVSEVLFPYIRLLVTFHYYC
jgi:hypothetical protein